MKRVFAILLMVTLFCGSACAQSASPGNALMPIQALSIPVVPVVGMGEATHGNKEWNELRLDVFRYLVETHGFRVFALEADFGNCQAVNAVLQSGEGDMDGLASLIGMWPYRNEEVAALLAWIQQFNTDATDEDRIQFYGVDMQSIDSSKQALLSYIRQVDPAQADAYEASLAALRDETRYTAAKEDIREVGVAVEAMLAYLVEKRETFVEATSEREYDVAKEYVDCLLDSTVYYGMDDTQWQERLNFRDQSMADRTAWILEHETKFGGNENLFVTAHTGHIEKTSAGYYTCMGNHLADKYGSDYYAIGTEFQKSTFLAIDEETSDFSEFALERTGPMIDLLTASGLDTAFVQFTPEMETSPEYEAFYTVQNMTNIGSAFADAYLAFEQAYTLPMIPSASFDALILVREAMPSTLLPKITE